MSVETAQAHLARFGRAQDILLLDQSSATVELAAQALGVPANRIAKTLSFLTKEGPVLIVAAGDARIDNARYKAFFHEKAKMLSAQEVLDFTSHPVGGVCPFGLPAGVRVYLDESLGRFDLVYPACGSGASAIALTCQELFEYSGALQWADLCKGWRDEQ